MTHKENWQVWRSIQDRIISHPDYRYGRPNTRLLLNLAEFASQQMGKFNTLHHGPSRSCIDMPVRFQTALLRRQPSTPECIFRYTRVWSNRSSLNAA